LNPDSEGDGVAVEQVRNVVLLGQNGSGKTTLAEALLYRAGQLGQMGTVEAGTTVADTEPEEHERDQSLSLTVLPVDWDGHRINVIDTPGYADFTGEALAGLRVADLALFVIDAVRGVQPQDELLWRAAARLDRPRMLFVNKMDRERAGFDRTLGQIKERLTDTGIEPVELPVGEEATFHGVADLITEHLWLYDSGRGEESDELDPEIADREHAEHDHLVEDVVERDDELLERYLEGEEPSAEELEQALHEGVDRAMVFPVLVGSASEPIGVDRLADFIVHVGPAPHELPPPMVEVGDDLVEIECDPAGRPLAQVFKTVADPYVGQLSVFKVLSGTIEVDDVLVNPRTGVHERMHGLVRLRGATHEPVDRVVAGDIGAVTKLADLEAGDTLAPEGTPVRLPPIDFPEPVHEVAITARSRADEDKLAVALHKIVHEDPTCAVEQRDETHQTVLKGMGETHIQVILDRIARRHGVEVDTEPVLVAYRETLAGPAEVEGRHKKQSGGRGQFGVATVRFEPLERGRGFDFDDEVVGGAIPKGLIPAVEKGLRESMQRGGNHGFPVVDVRAVLVDGKHHAVDSDEMSFRMAGARALSEAVRTAGTTVLEPISGVLVIVPAEQQGDVMGDLNSRRGHVTGTEAGPGEGEAMVTASVPTSEIAGYAVDLRSMTHGRGRFTASFERYEPMPAHLIDALEAPG
jgi:elongation factor G